MVDNIFIRELSVRYRKRRVSRKTCYFIGQKACDGDAVASLFRNIQQETVEKLFVLHLNSQNVIESFQLVSIGTLTIALVSPCEVFKGALLANAASIICVHNHPSGNPEPSIEDKEITKELRKIGKIIGIKVLDHIIIGTMGYYSIIHKRSGYYK